MVVRTARVWLPGYLFARVGDGQSIAGVNDTLFVSRVVYVGDEPVPIADAELDDLRRFLRSQRPADPEPIELYAPGDRVEFGEDSVCVGYGGTVIVDTGDKIRISCPQLSANPVTVTKRHYVRSAEQNYRVA
jgi:transcription antitermination factor NusG